MAALLRHLVREGALDADDIGAIAGDLDSRGEQDAAHQVRVALIEAHAPSQSEWEADRRRNRFHVIASDGGKAEG